MVPFAGYSMPVQYSDLSLSESHNWTREKCSLFDVGHMYADHIPGPPFIPIGELADTISRVQHHFSGPGAAAFLERLTPFSSANLQHNQSTLSCLLHPFTGGTVDDTVITRLGPELFYLVTNAACKEKDLAFFGAELEGRDKSQGAVEWTVREKWGLVALQGPLSADVLQRTLENLRVEDVNLKALYFGQCASVNIPVSSTDSATSSRPDFTLLISRGGYTGEDGFEISIPPDFTVKFAQLLLEAGGDDRLRLAGLGARDSLRLEAGMCLYGHDLNDDITPVEAGLSWVIHKDRRASGGFNGDATILRQLKPAKEGGGVKRRRVGLRIEHGPPAREGASISIGQDDTDSEEVGRVTSGCPSPTLGENIAMGYVESGHHKAGTKFTVAVRGKSRFTEVVKMPFVPSKYWKQAAGTSPG